MTCYLLLPTNLHCSPGRGCCHHRAAALFALFPPTADIIFVIDQEVNSMGREPRVWVLKLFTTPTRWPFSFEHSRGRSPAREALGAGSTGQACVQ